jgi:tRNA-specific 2-thiouridylase
VASSGEVLGRHEGIFNFTVGQRKGLGVSSPSPLYVLQIDPASHRVTVGADEELATRTLRARRLNWISIPELTAPMRVRIKIRHRHEPAWATLEPGRRRRGVATFDEPQRAVTPGQSAVFYDGDEVVGGGWIVHKASGAVSGVQDAGDHVIHAMALLPHQFQNLQSPRIASARFASAARA